MENTYVLQLYPVSQETIQYSVLQTYIWHSLVDILYVAILPMFFFNSYCGHVVA